MTATLALTGGDLAALEARGISCAEAERQLALLAKGPAPARLARAATVGDGIERLTPPRQDELVTRAEAAREAGRFTKVVPASGAATRMFRALQAILDRAGDPTWADLATAGEAGDEAAAETARFVEELPGLALARPLAARLGVGVGELAARSRERPLRQVLEGLLGATGLDAGAQPKGLLPFHADAAGVRTAFVEQLAEGLGYLADRRGGCRYHFTVPPGTSVEFARELARARGAIEVGAVRLDVVFTEQDPSTDTLALDPDGRPARRPDGSLLLRPAGHGALLANLEGSGADIALVKNIDNVLPPATHETIARWKLVLAGRLLELEAGVARRLRALEGHAPSLAAIDDALAWAETEFGRRPDPVRYAADRVTAVRALLERPIRVAGVVPNAGEPGGGPFWVAERDGSESLQIVESSQIAETAEQRAIFAAATHFNPVDLALTLRDTEGRPFDLARFVDPETSFVATKFEGGRELVVLERPGLWNGAMAGWNTVFVEVPASTFAPVKTVLDLARPEHRVG